MTDAGATSVVVDLGGSLGILTDRDLRTRVVAGGLSHDAPVSEAMTAPAYTVAADRLGSEVWLDMLDRGVRHFPVLSATGRGARRRRGRRPRRRRDAVVVSPAGRRSPARRPRTSSPRRRATCARPSSRCIARGRRRCTSPGIHSVVVDALIRRLIELAVADAGEPPTPFAWLALGSLARREALPGSDVDSAVAWRGEDDGSRDPRATRWRSAAASTRGSSACGLRVDAQGTTAANPLLVRSLASWRRAAQSWLEDPTQEQALILVSVVVDSRPVWGIHTGVSLAEGFRDARSHPALLRQLARFSLSFRPPTGFLRGLVVEHSGEHRGRLDLKHGGLVPIVDLARWAGMAAGVTSASTPERLRAAAAAGTLSAADAATLARRLRARSWACASRITSSRSKRARSPTTTSIPPALSPLTRRYLKEAFRAVASVQKGISNELSLHVR